MYFQALTKFLKCVNWSMPQEAKQALELLTKWSPMDVEDALELLSPAYTHPAVRKYAVTRLQQAEDDVRGETTLFFTPTVPHSTHTLQKFDRINMLLSDLT